MRLLLPAWLCLAAAFCARADLIEFQNGAETECHVLSLFDQRLEYANKDGSVTHVDFQLVRRILFVSKTAMITTRDRLTFNGQLVGLEDGMFTLAKANGAKQLIAAAQVTDFTVSDEKAEAPPKPPAPRPKPAVLPASSSPATGSIQPERGKITIVDFYADWCGPCRKCAPALEKLAAGNSDIALQKVNIDKQRDLAHEYNVTAIPHIIVYDKSAREVDQFTGFNEARLRKAIAAASEN
jgi:thioredoxin 1